MAERSLAQRLRMFSSPPIPLALQAAERIEELESALGAEDNLNDHLQAENARLREDLTRLREEVWHLHAMSDIRRRGDQPPNAAYGSAP